MTTLCALLALVTLTLPAAARAELRSGSFTTRITRDGRDIRRIDVSYNSDTRALRIGLIVAAKAPLPVTYLMFHKALTVVDKDENGVYLMGERGYSCSPAHPGCVTMTQSPNPDGTVSLDGTIMIQAEAAIEDWVTWANPASCSVHLAGFANSRFWLTPCTASTSSPPRIPVYRGPWTHGHEPGPVGPIEGRRNGISDGRVRFPWFRECGSCGINIGPTGAWSIAGFAVRFASPTGAITKSWRPGRSAVTTYVDGEPNFKVSTQTPNTPSWPHGVPVRRWSYATYRGPDGSFFYTIIGYGGLVSRRAFTQKRMTERINKTDHSFAAKCRGRARHVDRQGVYCLRGTAFVDYVEGWPRARHGR